MKSRIMYIEFKGTGINGTARIGNVEFSKSGRSIYYQGRRLQKILRSGYKLTTLTLRLAMNTGSRAANEKAEIVCTLAPSKSMRMYAKRTGLRFANSPKTRISFKSGASVSTVEKKAKHTDCKL